MVSASAQQKRRAQALFDDWFQELGELTDEALGHCDVLLAFGGPGIGTGMREWVKRCGTTHGREHDLYDDALLATVIEESQAIARFVRAMSSSARPPDSAECGAPPSTDSKADTANAGVDDLVRLDEAAAIVHRSKKTLQRRLRDMPAPYVRGGGGKPSLWKWCDLRPWLEREYIPDLPKRFPRNVR
jgi:hypothetical protein